MQKINHKKLVYCNKSSVNYKIIFLWWFSSIITLLCLYSALALQVADTQFTTVVYTDNEISYVGGGSHNNIVPVLPQVKSGGCSGWLIVRRVGTTQCLNVSNCTQTGGWVKVDNIDDCNIESPEITVVSNSDKILEKVDNFTNISSYDDINLTYDDVHTDSKLGSDGFFIWFITIFILIASIIADVYFYIKIYREDNEEKQSYSSHGVVK
jgi:hypothetical protein